ncbi:MAG: tRNA (N6-threonylcarbamoyladenosine(37)-N6)-methyltransferase TrmO [Ruminococcaceae bacterium]|nr:tRNA (N6-threonylcarbamoyladenosine(37)-N6)-methyltransferase TrmO [Oscillospiraceae bacterium]
MNEELTLRPVAHIRSDFRSKFGIPRQSGIVESLSAEIVFEEEFRNPDMLRGLEDFSHLWLIWHFSANRSRDWSPTVRPPRLGGNVRMGVFATRSPFRPNPVGLSCVRLLEIVPTASEGHILRIGGADLMDGTPILDIKPYVPYADAHPEALEGFTSVKSRHVEVSIAPELLHRFPSEKQAALLGILAQDPRPSYQTDPGRVYGFGFAGHEIRFFVADGVLTVTDVL